MKKSIFVWATIPTKQAFYEDAKQALSELVKITRKEKDCFIFQLLESKMQSHVFHLYEHFASEEALIWHLDQDYTRKVKDQYDLWLSGPLLVEKAWAVH